MTAMLGGLPLPNRIDEQLQKSNSLQVITEGKSGALVYRISINGCIYYLKINRNDVTIDPIRREYAVLSWLVNQLPIPRIVCFEAFQQYEYLLTEAIDGIPGHFDEIRQYPDKYVTSYAKTIRMIHSVAISECAFFQKIDDKLKLAEIRLKNGEIDHQNFDQLNLSFSEAALFKYVSNHIPNKQHLVFTHGDPYFNNMIFKNGNIVGIVDWARGGIADYHYDIAIALHNVKINCGSYFTDAFLRAYNRPIDDELLDYYWKLNEFF